jgi:hypothetical protein
MAFNYAMDVADTIPYATHIKIFADDAQPPGSDARGKQHLPSNHVCLLDRDIRHSAALSLANSEFI